MDIYKKKTVMNAHLTVKSGKYTPMVLCMVVSKVADVSGQTHFIAVLSFSVFVLGSTYPTYSYLLRVFLRICIFIGTLTFLFHCVDLNSF